MSTGQGTIRPRLSVVIPTRDRVSLLQTCLDSVLAMESDPGAFELIVVPNDAKPETTAVAQRYAHHPSVSVVELEEASASAARNAGWRAAQGDIVAFIDDDARVDPAWYEKVMDFFRRNPAVRAAGGPYDAYLLKPRPTWFPENYGSGGPAGEEGPLAEGQWLCGTCMIFQRSLLEEINGFDETIGPGSNGFGYAEDSNITKRILDSGIPVFRSPSLKVEHALLPAKYSLRWLLGSSFRCGRDQVAALDRRDGKGRCLLVLAKALLQGITFISASEQQFKGRLYSGFKGAAFQAGVFCGMIRRDYGKGNNLS